MFKQDQETIYGDIARHNKIRIKNTKRLKQIIKKIGWPTSDIVSKKGELATWLIVQHTDYNPKFQEKCLRLLKKLPKTKERKGHIAYLTDRVCINKNKKQIYGTQFHEKNGKIVPQQIFDEVHLEKRRKDLGLGSFKEYTKRLLKFNKEYKKKRLQVKT